MCVFNWFLVVLIRFWQILLSYLKDIEDIKAYDLDVTANIIKSLIYQQLVGVVIVDMKHLVDIP